MLDRRSRSNTGRRARGFSTIEALVASGVLGIGLVALVDVHGSTVENLARGRHVVEATRIAEQRLELLATQRPDLLSLPACGAGPLGCREDSENLTAEKPCTTWVDGAAIPTPSGVLPPSNSLQRGYRMDLVIGTHPDGLNHPGGLLATVTVCWRDDDGHVQELRSDRLLVPGT